MYKLKKITIYVKCMFDNKSDACACCRPWTDLLSHRTIFYFLFDPHFLSVGSNANYFQRLHYNSTLHSLVFGVLCGL